MKNPAIAIVLIFILISSFGYSQSTEIKIKFISNCGLLMTDGTTNVYSDFPYRSGAFNYDEFDQSELDNIKENSIFIFTHTHGDHYSKKNMKEVIKKKNGRKYGKWNISELGELNKTIPDLEIKAFKTKHRFSFHHYSYLITWHGKKIFLSGDTESSETIGKVKDMDWAFIPAWLAWDSKEKEITLDSKKIGIYHIGPRDDINITGEKVLLLKKQGEVISLPID